MDNADAPLDVDRLTKPEAEAFRMIAAALGARFAGDANDTPPPAPRAPRPAAAPTADPRAAALLEHVPVPAVVVDGGAAAFINRAAQLALGYASAEALDAAGGLGALFRRGEAPAGPGTMTVAAANGASFAARVTMSAVDWGAGRAMLVTLEPHEARPPAADGIAGDAVGRLLDANPDPVALVNRAGAVEAYNAAFERLAPGGRTVRLDGRLDPADRGTVLATIEHAFRLAEGVAEPPLPVHAGGVPHRVTVGTLPGGHLACLVLHPLAPVVRAASTAVPARGALERAVDDVRRLVDEAAVLVILDGAPDDGGGDAAVRFWRSLILSIAARAEVGSVLTVRHEDGATSIRLAPRSMAPFDRALASVRLSDLADAAGLAFGLEADALAVRPACQSDPVVTRIDGLR